MLLNLNDLKNYTEALAKRVPSIAHRVTIKEPGISVSELQKISGAINIPPIYANCICALNLFGVAIGYFSLWPGSINAGNMADALLNANQGNYLGANEARGYGLIVVAQEESNLICVEPANVTLSDAVYLLDVMQSSKVERIDAAPDFERFLLLAGNIHDFGRKYGDDPGEATKNMLNCCKHFACTSNQTSFWMSRMEALCS